jgi:predicted ferric reductase
MTTDAPEPTARRLSFVDLPIAVGVILCVFSVALHSIRIYREIQFARRFPEAPAKPLHILLILPFLISMVGLLLRSRLGLALSIFALGCVLLVYASWYEASFREWKLIHEFSPVPELIPSHALGLLNASWLDIAILFAVLIVLVWQVKFLIRTFRHRE